MSANETRSKYKLLQKILFGTANAYSGREPDSDQPSLMWKLLPWNKPASL